MLPSTNILKAARLGNLPKYSIVTPSGYSDRLVGTKSSQHNGTSMMAGDNWIGQVVSAIQNGPDWDSTAIFITYDDCGCFYDHVPPPLNPDGSRGGVRLPMVVASPWVRAGSNDSTPTSLAGVLAFVVGLALIAGGVLQWRAAAFGALDPRHTMRWLIPGVTLSVLGGQLVFGSFFISLLRMRRRVADARAREARGHPTMHNTTTHDATHGPTSLVA